MKERFRSYVWRCDNCKAEFDTKPKKCDRTLCNIHGFKVEKRIPRQLAALLAAEGIPEPVCEYVFNDKPAYRWDWAWPQGMYEEVAGAKIYQYHRIAIEIDGGIFQKGASGHKGAGARDDRIKGNLGVIKGWRVLRFLPEEITNGSFLSVLKQVWES